MKLCSTDRSHIAAKNYYILLAVFFSDVLGPLNYIKPKSDLGCPFANVPRNFTSLTNHEGFIFNCSLIFNGIIGFFKRPILAGAFFQPAQ